jgi:dTDP-glucose pyrophosphorylase
MNKNSPAIILCGGNINYSNLPIGTNVSNAMIPVNGKPVIGWILDDVMAKGIKEAIVVLQTQNAQLYSFLSWAYKGRLELTFAFVNEGGTILHSLLSGLNAVKHSESVHIILGDTLIQDNFEEQGDFVFVGQYDVSRNWCLVETDTNHDIIRFYDKTKSKLNKDSLTALTGYYHLADLQLSKQCVLEALNKGSKELSSMLELYNLQRKIRAVKAQRWFDFGHIDHFVQAKRSLLQSRFFNSLQIDPVLSTVTKKSQKSEKLADELNWYKLLPEKLKLLAPRIIETESSDNEVIITQEYYGYPNMAELYLYGNLDDQIWHTAIDNLFNVHRLICTYKGEVTAAEVTDMYWSKTIERIEMLKEQEPQWVEWLDANTLVINEKEYRNFAQLKPLVEEKVKHLAATVEGAVLHGDYCLSNILYDINNHIVRLIDPRGSFGKPGVYGDPRYDVAKLRHSICGLYDYIVSDIFNIKQTGTNSFEYSIYANDSYAEAAIIFDELLQKNGYSLNEIKFIEGLLFVSMVPYHQGKPLRQRLMYLKGITLLNEVL